MEIEENEMKISLIIKNTVGDFFIIKPTRCANFTNLFWHETLHVSDSSSVHHQELIHSAMMYAIQVCRQLSSRTLVLLESCLQTV